MKFPVIVVRSLAAAFAALAVGLAGAHGSSVGEIEIEHPYATPSLAGATIAAAYFAALENKGTIPDKLVRAETPVAASVEMHTMSVDAQGVMRMREVGGFALAAKESLRMKPGMGAHLMLIGLKRPLKDGETFPMTLQFEHAGKVEIKVVVQTPRASADMPGMQMH
jgi:copper(I)-binding protein